MRSWRHVLAAVAACVVVLATAFGLVLLRHAANRLESLGGKEGFSSAEEAMRTLLLREHPGGRIALIGSGNDAPGLRFVTARVRPGARTGSATVPAGRPREVGRYFLRMDQGWVHLPDTELAVPVVAMGKALLDSMGGDDRVPETPRSGR